ARRSELCQRALDRLAHDVQDVAPSVVVVVGNDQLELFHYDNMPALSIFYGDRIVMAELPGKETDQGGAIAHGYAMDEHHEFDGAATLAREVIEHMVDDGVDVGACNAVSDPSAAGIGHAVGFVERRILRDGSGPVIPLLV